jgi:hypothetical protein
MMVAMSDINLDELRDELDEFSQPEKPTGRSAREERIIAGFEEIQRFVEQHGRVPQHGEHLDIFERLYAVRLDRLRTLDECRLLLAPLDSHSLLVSDGPATQPVETMDDDELLAELAGAAGPADITDLRHVRTAAEKRAAEEIANRAVCEDFEAYKPLFEQVRSELKSNIRDALPVEKMDEIKLAGIQKGSYFIIGGQLAYVAEVGEDFKTQYDRRDSRLRVIYDNGTENSLLMRSFQRALYRDTAARLISNPTLGSLFAEEHSEDDLAAGTIYVLRSKSEHPVVAAHRDILHKVGVTGGNVARRVVNAKLDPTYLMADVEIVATYELYNINRTKLENIIHRVFEPARLDIEIKDRFGMPVIPREWFLVPIFVVDDAVKRIKDGTITRYIYDPSKASLVLTSN